MHAESLMDDGTPIKLAVTIDRKDGTACFDFTGVYDSAVLQGLLFVWVVVFGGCFCTKLCAQPMRASFHPLQYVR